MPFRIGKNCRIHPTAVIDVREGFLGDGAFIREGARIEGYRVEIGRECFMDRGAMIGGGSCFDPDALLEAGDWLHMGLDSQINIARPVKIGHEFGCGIETKVFTHGAYIDSYALGAPVQWAPVTIGDNVWMPNAWVNPGTKIGSNVVVAARSLVNRDLPEGCLAGGIPVKILKEGFLPRAMSEEEKREHLEQIIEQAKKRLKLEADAPKEGSMEARINGDEIHAKGAEGTARFQLISKTMEGSVGAWSRMLKDQLRRNGIRFRFKEENGVWKPWASSRFEI